MATRSGSPAGMPKLLKRHEMRPHWDLPNARTVGYMRALHDGIEATNCEVNLVELHLGQGSPKHSHGGEVIIFLLEGEVEFEHGDDSWHLEPYDMLFIPANLPYEYRNMGLKDALFLSIVGRYDEWPAQGTYYDD
jgi:quercetin dioxygenase-like cupin family protein